MGLFGNNETQDRPHNPDAAFGFRALAAGYLLYLLYQTVQMHLKGESSDLRLLIASIVVLGGGGLFILISSFLTWRKQKSAPEEKAEESTGKENAE